MPTRTYWTGLLLLLLTQTAVAQTAPATLSDAPRMYEVKALRVEGIGDENLRAFIAQRSGLHVGQQVMIPGDPALAEAIRTLYAFRDFSDVKILDERRDDGIYLTIQVREEPRLADYTFEGVKKKQRQELKRKVPLFVGGHVRRNDIERARQIVRAYYEEKGRLFADVQVRADTTSDGAVNLTFHVDQGPRVEIGAVVIEGNEAVSDGRLRRQMKNTRAKRWWHFWGKATFEKDAYADDLNRLVAYYHEKGYYDARITGDTVYVRQQGGDVPEIVVEVEVHEGAPYYIRNITWDGNTVYTDEALTHALGFAEGDRYNSTKLEQNLFANAHGTDVASLYLNRGYMRFNVDPSVTVVAGDSLDLHFDVFESGVYTFGEVNIAGNLQTNDYVIRRELYTTPGQPFSRAAIQESIRRLAHLTYFDQTSLARGPEVVIDDEKRKVDLSYHVSEVSNNPLTVAGTYGKTGLILQLGLHFDNFSAQNLLNPKAWRPIPSGDGQQLSLGVQTSGRNYQRYSISFTEPWLRGKPTPFGFSLSHTRIKADLFSDTDDGTLLNTSASIFYDHRLKWPDDKFSLSTSLRYQFYDNDGWTESLPTGVSREVVFEEALTRNALDHPVFPTRGSLVRLSVEVAPPFQHFTQYHKWRLQTNWNVPLAKKFSFGISSDFGYIGSLTGADVAFQRFVVGGSPFETQGIGDLFGRDIVYLRGYPLEAIGPRRDETTVGGRVLNKYSAELHWHAVQTPQLTAVPYVFAEAANTWNDLSSYSPTDLFRSSGVGVRLLLPMLGVVDLNYGYNFDAYTPFDSHDGTRGWTFQISLGRTFNF